ncbi:MAG: zf-HC2 domain-containing protein [Chloroflexi bacterium]|nr:zf-HC2 domain-containing protein [Chloroflexota bacterium]
MTGPRSPHPEFEELISASLAGELGDDERRRLDAHLDACDACRGTLAAFADGRRIVAGLRHVPVPRDLHARVRGGIEAGRFAAVPWWRRPAVLFAGIGGGLAAVAGALLAIVLLNQPSGPVGEASPTPSPAPASAGSVTPSPTPSFPSAPTPTPGAATPGPSPTEPAPTATPAPTEEASPEPVAYLGHTGPFDNRALVVADGPTGEGIAEDSTAPGPPIAAELSPDGQWVAYVVRVGESGLHEVRATRIGEGEPSDDPDALPPIDSPVAVGETVILGESVAGDPFGEQLFWSTPRGVYLAYTLTDPETGDTDAWLFEPGTGESRQLTDTGNAYAASWIPGGDTSSAMLWVSTAGDQPVSHLHDFHVDAGGQGAPGDPSEDAMATAEGVFQPLLNASGRFAIYWNGTMERAGDGSWQFTIGGQPYLADHIWESEVVRFDESSERAVFRDLAVGRDGFASASITWGPDGDTYAIWDARWTGAPQSGANEPDYPDPRRVYFSRATDERGMTRGQAIDVADVPEDWAVVDVKLSPTGEHLVLTVARPLGGTMDPPEADLLLVERRFGDEADVVRVIRGEQDTNWWGPALFPQPGADRP